MRICVFGRRTAREILRDPLSFGFGLGFPLILLLLMTLIQRNIPVSLFEPEQLMPGITAFGLSFLCLFTATLVAKDRGDSLLIRLRATPMRSTDFFAGYLLPLLPLAVGQMVLTYGTAILLGLPYSARIWPAILVQLPLALFYLGAGLLCGCLLTERQVGGVCGALLTNLAAWLSGAWFDLSLMGETMERMAFLLPFANAVDAGRQLLAGGTVHLGRHMLIMSLYAAGMLLAALAAMRRLTNPK